jgi:hypothetical protein
VVEDLLIALLTAVDALAALYIVLQYHLIKYTAGLAMDNGEDLGLKVSIAGPIRPFEYCSGYQQRANIC